MNTSFLCRRATPAITRRESGAATLIVVMLLFFIMSMVAAYTSRNLIFEQRTSANQYRSSQAFEAAEAGVEWALAQLNAGLMTDACVPSTDVANQSFARRNFSINPATGAVTPNLTIADGFPMESTCVFDSANSRWSCACPDAGETAAAIAPPGGTGPEPAFILQFTTPLALPNPADRPDVILLEVNSCTRSASSCLNFSPTRDSTGDGVAANSVMLTLRGALTRPPAAALSAAGALTLTGGTTVSLVNTEPSVSGLTLHTGGVVPAAGLTLRGIAGVPPASTTLVDTTLRPPVAATGLDPLERTFALFFGVFSNTYFNQPGMVSVDCSANCDAAAVLQARERNPGRAIRIRGNAAAATLTTLSLNPAAAMGSPTEPLLLIVDGNVNVTFSASTFYGLIYGRTPPGSPHAPWQWTLNGATTIHGAVVSEEDLALTGGNPLTVNYDKAVLTALRVSQGTFVRVPGSWKDFQ